MIYRGQQCTPRAFSDATGTGTEWLNAAGSVVVRQHTTRIRSSEEIATDAIAVERQETAALAGIQLNADPLKRAKCRPIEECKSLKPQAGAVATHVLHTTIQGVRVKLLAIVDEED